MNTTSIKGLKALSFLMRNIFLFKGKRIGLVVFFVIGMSTAKAQSNVYQEDSAGCLRVMFTGQKDGKNAIRLIVKNNVKESTYISIIDEEGDRLYSGKWNEQFIDQTFLTDAQHDNLVFKISIGERVSVRTYNVAFLNKTTYQTSIVALR